MVKLKELQLQYVTDAAGRKISVLLPVEQFDRREEPTNAHEELVKELKRDGLLPD